jgi:hypothetical protein
MTCSEGDYGSGGDYDQVDVVMRTEVMTMATVTMQEYGYLFWGD